MFQLEAVDDLPHAGQSPDVLVNLLLFRGIHRDTFQVNDAVFYFHLHRVDIIQEQGEDLAHAARKIDITHCNPPPTGAGAKIAATAAL
jgi:hypothetical protein